MKARFLLFLLFSVLLEDSYSQTTTGIAALSNPSSSNRLATPIGDRSNVSSQWLAGGIFEGMEPNNEMLDSRTEFTKKFKRLDGKIDILFGGPFHYKEASGAWQDINLTIREQTSQKYKYINTENRFVSRFAAKCNDGVQMETNKSRIAFGISPKVSAESWSPSISNDAPAIIQSNSITYQNIYKDIDLNFSVGTDMIQHRMFFNQKSVFSSLTKQQDVAIDEIVEIPDSAVLIDRLGFVSTSRELVGVAYVVLKMDTIFSLLPPRIWDATFTESILSLIGDNLPNGVQGLNAYVSIISENKFKYTVTIPSEWLLDDSRVFPIVYDPTVYLGGVSSSALTYRYPFNTCRAQRADQILFHGSDIGVSGTVTSIGFYQLTNTGQSVNNVNVKMQEGGFADFSSCTFIPSGWTNCIPSTSLSAAGSGWRDLSFTTPFVKTSSASDLLIETRFNNCASIPMLTAGCSCSLTSPGGYWGAVSGLYYGHRWAFSDNCTSPPTSCPSAYDPCYGTGLENNTGYGTIIPITRLTVSSSCSGWYTFPSGASVSASGSAGNTFSVYVTSGSGCTYYATSSDTWINSIAYPGSSNIVSYTVDANPGSARAGTISVRDGSTGSVVATYTVSQAGAVSCVSPTAIVNDASGSGSVTLVCSAFGGSGGGYLYKWYAGVSCSGGVIGTGPTVTVGTDGYYTCKVYISGNEFTCYDCDYGYATVIPTGTAPIANFIPSTTSITYGSSITVSNTSTGTPTPTYSWSVSPSTGVYFSPSSTAINPIIHFANASTYTVTLVANNLYGTSSKSKIIHASPGMPTDARAIEEGFPMCRVAEPIDVGTASYGYKHTDFVIPTKNSMLNFTRYYNSVNASLNSALGYGWSHTYDCYVTNYADTLWSVHYADGHNCLFIPLYGGSGTSFSLYGGVYQSLYKNPSTGNFTLTFKSGEVYSFNALGKLGSVTDLNGNVTSIYYTGGKIDSVVGAGSRALYFSHTGPFLTSVSDALGRSVNFGHDGAGNLVSVVTNPDMHTTAIGYVGSHLLKYIINPLGDTVLHNIYDGSNRIVAQSDVLHLTTSFLYNSPGIGDATITYPSGDSEIVHHDNHFRMTRRTDELGHTKSFIYDHNNNIDTFIDENSRTLTFAHDSIGNLLAVNRPNGRTSTLTYSPLNKIKTIRNPVGHTDSMVYDANGNVTEVYLPNGARLTFYNNSAGLPDSAHDALGHASYFHYNGFGDLTSIITPSGIRSFSYDTVGRLISSTDPNSLTTHFVYTNTDKLRFVIDPYDDTISYVYDADDNLVQEKNKKGFLSTFQYDAKGRLARVEYPNGGIYRLGYDARDNLIADTNANGNTRRYGYDPRNRLSFVSNSLGTVRYGYDAAGNQVSDTDALGGVRLYNYDELYQIDSIRNELGNYSILMYDSLGQITRVRDPMGRSTTYHRNVIGLIDSVLDAHHYATSASYNLSGDITSLRDPKTHPLSYRYNASRRLTSISDATGVIDSFMYDAAGNVTTHRNKLGVISKTYDSLHRVTHIANTGGNNYDYSYDKNSNITSAHNTHGTATFVFDSLDHLIQYVDMFGDTVGYTYDLMGNKKTVRYPGGHIVRYGYNESNLLDSVTDWLGNVTRYTYDGNGRLKLILNPHNDSCKYTYNEAGELSGYVNVIGTHVVSKSSYTVNANGEKIYDEIAGPYPKHLREQSFAYTYNNVDFLLSDSVNNYEHDSAGNRKKDVLLSGIITDSFSVDNFLLSRTDSSGGVTFQYDALSNRVVRVKGSVYQRFIHDLSGRLPQVLTEMDSTGSVKANYVYGLGLISRIDSIGNILYYHFNAQHNTIALSNDSGLVTDTYTYEDFGKMLSHNGTSDQPYTYLGQYGVEQESPTLYYMRARYYDAANHRFLSKDPYTITLENPQTINRYIYALNNPLEYSDPTGLYAEKDNQFSKGTRVLNGFQTVLDVAGLIPGFGEPLDALNALIYLARGDRLNFALSAAAVIPFLGWGATAGKIATKESAQLLLKAPTARLLQNDLEHIVEKHWFSSGAKKSGKFLQGTTGRELKKMIEKATSEGVFSKNTYDRLGQIAVYDFGRIIGTSNGVPTSKLKVVIDEAYNVKTAYPIK